METKTRPFLRLPLDSSWTLFLDRDGVINVNKPESYVFNTKEFIFCEGALEAIARVSKVFGKVIVITNQRGVGKGLMTEEDLQEIHSYMKEKIEKVSMLFFIALLLMIIILTGSQIPEWLTRPKRNILKSILQSP
jgi:histidinol phosphatase-like enzyme